MFRTFLCFPFFNELEILKLKLEECYNVVDYIILSESSKTHSGLDKPFYFQDHLDEFVKYSNKIIYSTRTNTPNSYTNLPLYSENLAEQVVFDKIKKMDWWPKGVESYGRDTYEKEMLLACLIPYASEDDIVIFGDADEIPSAKVITEIKENFNKDQIYNLEHKFYWYYLNILKSDETWLGNRITSFRTFYNTSCCELRVRPRGINIPNAGWHFSYMGGSDRIKTKIQSFGEQTVNKPEYTNNISTRVANCLKEQKDLYGRPAKFEKVAINYENHPKYLVDHREEFRELLYEYR